MTSDQFRKIQNMLGEFLTKELGDSMSDYDLIRDMVEAIESIDLARRQAWHKERFGSYEDMADEALNNFTAEDIPF